VLDAPTREVRTIGALVGALDARVAALREAHAGGVLAMPLALLPLDSSRSSGAAAAPAAAVAVADRSDDPSSCARSAGVAAWPLFGRFRRDGPFSVEPLAGRAPLPPILLPVEVWSLREGGRREESCTPGERRPEAECSRSG
jgi:hypothetical protein